MNDVFKQAIDDTRLKSRITRLELVIRSLVSEAERSGIILESASDAQTALSESEFQSDDFVNANLINVNEFSEYWESCDCSDLTEMSQQLQQFKRSAGRCAQ